VLRSALAAVSEWAANLGGVGLLIIAALDSSFLSFPQVNDVLIVYLSTAQPELMAYYAGMSTIGSVAGCAVLFFVGRRGGEAFLLSRFKAEHIERALRLYARFGIFTVLIPSLLPPPTPFKMLVLLAGASGLAPWRFILAVSLGRGARYFGTGYLAVLYGEHALDILRRHGVRLGVGLALVVAIAGIATYVWQQRQTKARAQRQASGSAGRAGGA
jgi:membrane protein YqaA with SNARE-associated domain